MFSVEELDRFIREHAVREDEACVIPGVEEQEALRPALTGRA
jgi:hypothetical protein